MPLDSVSVSYVLLDNLSVSYVLLDSVSVSFVLLDNVSVSYVLLVSVSHVRAPTPHLYGKEVTIPFIICFLHIYYHVYICISSLTVILIQYMVSTTR